MNSGQLSDKEHEDRCVTCGKEVKEDDEALQCDLGEVWEHLICIKVCDRPTNDCYAALLGHYSVESCFSSPPACLFAAAKILPLYEF